MNQDQMLSLLRTVLQIVGTIIVSHGTLGINGALWEQISGVVIIIGPTIWSMYAHTHENMIASVTANPDVKQIVVSKYAVDGAARAAADPTQPKVVNEMTAPVVFGSDIKKSGT
jgi:hypothetical protein